MSTVTIAPLAESLPAFLDAHDLSAIAVIADNHTAKFCYPDLKPLLPKHTLVRIKAGEEQKHIATCELIWDAFTRAGFDRYALVLNLGGGVIGDMGGFCAATYKRGIAFAQLPTTLLAQVDASVGGKLGIDFNGLKNHIGVFQQPNAVFIDPSFLGTLPERELRSGFAEIIKHCLIADVAMWDHIRVRDLSEQNWPALVAHSVAVKQRVVAQDPTEKGLRKILNFGHTLGHAVETYYLTAPSPQRTGPGQLRKRLLHGEAIAVGMVAEAFMAFQKNMIDQALMTQIEDYLFSVYGSVRMTEAEIEPILKLTKQDKKNRDNQVLTSLLNGPGSCTFDVPVTMAEMRRGLSFYGGLSK